MIYIFIIVLACLPIIAGSRDAMGEPDSPSVSGDWHKLGFTHRCMVIGYMFCATFALDFNMMYWLITYCVYYQLAFEMAFNLNANREIDYIGTTAPTDIYIRKVIAEKYFRVYLLIKIAVFAVLVLLKIFML